MSTESAYYESLGVFFNGPDADTFIRTLEQAKLPVRFELLVRAEQPDEAIGVEVFVKKSAVEPALKIKNDIIEATLDNPEFYLNEIPDDELLQIPLHPEDANDFDYWAALELIRRKKLPLEERDWEQFRMERMMEIIEQKAPKTSGLPAIGYVVWLAGIIVLALTYKAFPYLTLLFFAGSFAVGKHLTSQNENFSPKEQKQGKIIMSISVAAVLLSLYFSYKVFTS